MSLIHISGVATEVLWRGREKVRISVYLGEHNTFGYLLNNVFAENVHLPQAQRSLMNSAESDNKVVGIQNKELKDRTEKILELLPHLNHLRRRDQCSLWLLFFPTVQRQKSSLWPLFSHLFGCFKLLNIQKWNLIQIEQASLKVWIAAAACCLLPLWSFFCCQKDTKRL